jgi:CheY-like chemotaxis protein/RIO-like serine/threonine protein kinase
MKAAKADKEALGPLLEQLQQIGLIMREDWQALRAPVRIELAKHTSRDRLLARLVEEKLLTSFQADMIGAGKMHGLVLGNYRALERLGVGDMAVVFRAEHIKTRQEVAVKVLAPTDRQEPNTLLRFMAERKMIAQLRHPNIVNVLDIGEQQTPDPDQPQLFYYVMEHVAGQDLEMMVKRNGPLPAARACEIVYQVAGALAEAHRHHLVHRNVEPANILVTEDGKVKLLDFGLARQHQGRMTEPGTSLGTLEYISPEQAKDASAVDIRADIYGLGATLFWCLTGKLPYAFLGPQARDLAVRLATPPQGPQTVRSEIPAAIDAVVVKMMALKPEERFTTPEEVMQALEPFLPPGSEARELASMPAASAPAPAPVSGGDTGEDEPRPAHVLIVDMDEAARTMCRQAAEAEGLSVAEAASAKDASAAVTDRTPDIVLLADQLSDQPGLAVLRKIRQASASPHQKVIMLVGAQNAVKQVLAAGADDYIIKPLDSDQLQARVKTAAQLKEAQVRADRLARQLAAERAAPPPVEKPVEKPKKGLLGRLFGKR